MSPKELMDFIEAFELTEKDFCEMVGVTRPALDHWIAKRRKIPAMLVKLVRFFEKHPEMMPDFYAS